MALVLTPASLASADLVPSPPESCRDGARPRANRAVSFCEPTTCESDDDCEQGERCSEEPIPLCVEEEEVAIRRGLGDEDPRTVLVRRARRRGCEPDGTCLAMTATCERVRRCVAVDARDGEAEPEPPHDPDPRPEAETDTEQEGTGERAGGGRPGAPSRAGGCGCHVPAAPAPGPSVPFALLAVVVVLRRRRQSTHQGP